jgi:hypothetical protein
MAGRPRRWRWEDVRGMSSQVSGVRKRGARERKMLVMKRRVRRTAA